MKKSEIFWSIVVSIMIVSGLWLVDTPPLVVISIAVLMFGSALFEVKIMPGLQNSFWVEYRVGKDMLKKSLKARLVWFIIPTIAGLLFTHFGGRPPWVIALVIFAFVYAYLYTNYIGKKHLKSNSEE